MRKLFKLFLLFMLTAVALPALGASHTVYMNIDNTSSLMVRHASLASTNLGTGRLNGSDVSGVQNGFKEYSIGNDYLLIGNSDKSAPYAVYVNGVQQSTSTGNNYTFYRINLGRTSTPTLIEVYTSSSTPTYTYPLYLEITDPDSHITSINGNKGHSYSAPFSSPIQFSGFEQFTVNSTKTADPEPSLSGKLTSVSQNGDTYSFTPFPSVNSSTDPKFFITIPDDNYISEYDFQAMVDNMNQVDDLGNYVANYYRTCPHNPLESQEFSLSDIINSTTTKFHEGDTYTIEFYNSGHELYVNGVELTCQQVEKDGETFYDYTFTPVANSSLRITINTGGNTGGGNTSSESEYTVYFKADRAGVVVAYSFHSGAKEPCATTPIGTEYTAVTSYQRDSEGRIELSLVDSSMNAFTDCKDTEKDASFTQYAETTKDIVVKYSVTQGQSEGFTTDGHHIEIKTKDLSTLKTYKLNLDITDDPSHVVVKLGTSRDMSNESMRPKNNLVLGRNEVTYVEGDTYMLVSGINFENPLYSVECVGASMDTMEGMPPVYAISLDDANTQNATVTVTANRPEVVGSKSFTLNIDHLQYINNIRRYDDPTDQIGNNINMANLHDGANTITFEEGQSFSIYLLSGSDQVVPQSATINGSPMELNFDLFYKFTPADGDNIVVEFGEVQVKENPKFTVLCDAYNNNIYLRNVERTTQPLIQISQESTVIEYLEGDVFEVMINSGTISTISFGTSLDDREFIEDTNGSYNFVPFDGGYLWITFQKNIAPPSVVPLFTINIDDATKVSSLVEYDSNYNTVNTYTELVDGENEIPVGNGIFVLTVIQQATSATIGDTNLDYTAFPSKCYTFTATEGCRVNVKFATDPKYTLIVDDPSKIASYKNASTDTSLLDGLQTGANEVQFVAGQSFSITPVAGATPLAITLGGNDVTATDGAYTYSPADGDVVKLFFNYVPAADAELVSFKVVVANPGTEGVINYGWVGDTQFEGASAITGGLLVEKGEEIGVNYYNHNFHINSITINGNELSSNTGAVNIPEIRTNTVVVFDVTAPTAINYTVNVATPDNVVIYYGDVLTAESRAEFRYNEDREEGAPAQTSFSFETTSLKPQISIAPVGEIFITEVKAGADTFTADENGIFSITLTDGMVIDITTKGVENTDMLVVCIDIREGEYEGMAASGKLIGHKSGRVYELVNGRNIVMFNSDFDGGFRYGFATMPDDLYSYLNDEEIVTSSELQNLFYLIYPQDGDIIRSYCYHEPLTDEEGEPITDGDGNIQYPDPEDLAPEQHEVEFSIGSEFTGSQSVEVEEGVYENLPTILIKREDVQDVDHSDTATEYTGTRYFVYALTGTQKLWVGFVPAAPAEEQNGSQKAPRRAEAEEAPAHITPAGYDFIKDITIDKPGTIKIVDYTTTGIEDVVVPEAAATGIYNIQGILIGSDASDVKALPAGLYIVNGHKVLVK